MTGPFAEYAAALLQAGYSPLPIISGRKKPALKGWSALCETPLSLGYIRDYSSRWPMAGLGVALGYAGVLAVDLDTIDGRQIAAITGTIPRSPVAKQGRRGLTRYYRAPAGVSIQTRHFAGIVDLISAGGSNVLPPSMHPAGMPYRWLKAPLWDVPATDLPEVPADLEDSLEDALEPWLPRRQFEVSETRADLPAGQELRRLTAFARSKLASQSRDLASTAEGDRNNWLFGMGAGLGRYAFQGIVKVETIEAAALAACLRNGLLKEDGRLSVLASLHSGLEKGRNDPLPVLRERRLNAP